MFPYGRAICYSGYRENESPIKKVYPTYVEVLEDLTFLSKHFDYIRMYDPYQHAQTVLKVLKDHQLPLKVMIGVEPRGEISNPNCPWGGLHSEQEIEENKVFNFKQLDILAGLANEYESHILALAVGNECTSDWHHNLMAPEKVAEHVRYLKSKTNLPVSFCEGAHYWQTKGKPIAEVVDFISIHSYPLWNKIPVEKALDYTINDYKINKKAYPNKEIIFTEYGWATSDNGSMLEHQANIENQEKYLNAVEKWQKDNKITMFLFEAFDEPWKGSGSPTEPEKHWGIFDVNRKPKGFAKKYK
jgi:exo-beta-1,3-glucanase (GH17 family)